MANTDANRFHALDAMRGMAAILVALYHFGGGDPDRVAGAGGYLAVDFFFLLSGLVIARAYDSRLKGAMSLRDFSVIRLIRLYPLFLAGVLIGCLKPFGQLLVGDDNAPEFWRVIHDLSLNLLMAPVANGTSFFPLNNPAWSLFFELIANFVYAALLVRASKAVLVVVIGVAGAALAYGAITHHTIDLGWSLPTGEFGLARVFFSFTLGVLFYRLGLGEKRTVSAWAFLPIVILPIVLLIPVAREYRGFVDAAAAIVLFPILILWNGRLEIPARFHRACAFLGDVSYPLYALHYPIAAVGFMATTRLHLPYPATATLLLLTSMAASMLLLKYYDAPARAWLSRKAKRRDSAPPAFVKG